MPKKNKIEATSLIKIAEGYLARVKQWAKDDNFKYAQQYKTQAECVIEILEMMESGHIGGIHCGFPVGKEGLKKRLDHLKTVFL